MNECIKNKKLYMHAYFKFLQALITEGRKFIKEN